MFKEKKDSFRELDEEMDTIIKIFISENININSHMRIILHFKKIYMLRYPQQLVNVRE